MSRSISVALLSLCVVILVAAALSAQPADSGSVPGPSGKPGHLSAPAEHLQLPPPSERPRRVELPRPEEDDIPDVAARRPASLMRPRVVAYASTTPSTGFSQQGISKGLSGGAWDPADVTLAVGGAYVGEAVNSAIAWWQVGAGYSASPIRSLGDFFTTTAADRRTDQMSDPRMLFDVTSQRWFVAGFDVSRSEVDLAVSESVDPTQAWWIWALPAAGCPDQPRIGVSDTLLAVTYNLFASCGTRIPPYIGGTVLLFDKQAMLAGGAPAERVFGPDARFTSITPATPVDGGQTLLMVSTDYRLSQVVIYTATTVGQSTLPIQRVPIHLLQQAPPPGQAGTAIPLDPGDNRVQDAFASGGNVWLAANDGCTPVGAPAQQACTRLVEVSPNGQVLDEREEALALGRSASYSAMRPDSSGNIFMVYGYSSSADYPGLGATIDPGHGSSYSDLIQGTAANTSGRWGDYFSAARDPSDGSRVWVAGAYGASGGWGTYIAALATTPFSIPNPNGTGTGAAPGASPSPAGDTTPPRVRALASAGHRGSVVQLRYRLRDDSNRTRERIRIRARGVTIATVNTSLSRIRNGAEYFASWRAPLKAPTALSFCVVAFDAAANASQPSCASIRLN